MKTFMLAFGASLLVIVLAMPVAAVIMGDSGDAAGSGSPTAEAEAWAAKRRTPPAFRWWFKKIERRPSPDPTTAPSTSDPEPDDDASTPDGDDDAGAPQTTTTTVVDDDADTTTTTTSANEPDPDPEPEPGDTPSPSPSPSPTTAPPPTVMPSPAPANARFVEDFASAGSLDRFDFAIYHRDDVVNADNLTWPGDHAITGPNDLCGPPEEKRTINRGDRANGFNDEWIYRCVPGGDEAKAHIMTSIGDTSGYSIGGFAPKQTFQGIREIRWDVNITQLGNRQFTEVKVIPAAAFDLQNLPCSIEWLPCDTDLHRDLGSVGVSFNNHQMSINNGSDNEVLTETWGGPWFNPDDVAVNSIRTRRTSIFRDNGDGTLTYAVQQADGSFYEVSRAGRFPSGPVRVVFADHNYTPLKAENGRPDTFTWHWDNIVIG
ncbi:MAG: hypothetical protein AAF467_11105 [Actinomycetota bacterium]